MPADHGPRCRCCECTRVRMAERMGGLAVSHERLQRENADLRAQLEWAERRLAEEQGSADAACADLARDLKEAEEEIERLGVVDGR